MCEGLQWGNPELAYSAGYSRWELRHFKLHVLNAVVRYTGVCREKGTHQPAMRLLSGTLFVYRASGVSHTA